MAEVETNFISWSITTNPLVLNASFVSNFLGGYLCATLFVVSKTHFDTQDLPTWRPVIIKTPQPSRLLCPVPSPPTPRPSPALPHPALPSLPAVTWREHLHSQAGVATRLYPLKAH